MAEYRIVAKLDPQTSAGSQKVKQDLKGIQSEAKATETALSRSFDQAKFDKTIGALTTRLDQLDKKLGDTGRASAQAGAAFDRTTGSMERMTAAEFRAAGGLDGLNKKAEEGAMSQAKLEAALRRVLQATDAQAAEQLQMNALLADAKRLLDAGIISNERYAQVQKLAAGVGNDLNRVTGSQRIGMQQLGFQLGDVATMYALGARPAQIFASQIGQVSQALMLLGGDSKGGMLGKVAGFLGGPWGIALTLAVTILGPFIGKLFESGDALDELMKKKKEDAKESENARIVHERWIGTLDALIERQGRLADAMKDRLKVQGLSEQSDLQAAERDKKALEEEIIRERQRLTDLRRQLAEASRPVAGAGTIAGQAAQSQQLTAISRIQGEIKKSQGEMARLEGAIANAQTRIMAGQILVGEQQGKAMVDLATRAQQWGDRYQAALRGILARNDQLRAQTPTVTAGFEAVRAAVDRAANAGVNFSTTIGRTRELGLALEAGKISVSEYRSEMGKFASGLNAAADAAEKAKRTVSDGVSTFRSAAQAIGMAGREFQQAGFRVSENAQFGGVTGGHTGAGHAQGRAIDINLGKGVTEANVPEIRARLDAMAVRYAARGYIVLWNGKRYDPSGKVTPIPAGQDQHGDHMHLEAPTTIVGKPTQASTEAQARREEGQEMRVQERAEDFVANVVRGAAVRGVADNAQAQLASAIADKLKEFQDKFERAANPDEEAAIRGALTDASARETALRFEEAYVKPLERLQALQGKTGIDREVLNAQLEESARLGRELDPIEKAKIENGIRGNDQLERQAQILQDVRGPLEEYKATIAALNALLKEGEISQAAYNARIAEMGANAANAALGGLQGADPATGRPYEDVIAIAEEEARYAQQLVAFETYREQLLQAGISYDALELAAAQQHAANLRAIDVARRDTQMAIMQQAAGSITSIMTDAFGKQSKIARAAFIAEKAIAIARASLALAENVAQASKIGFPQNLPFIAGALAQGATIMSSIRSAGAAFQGGSYKEGGWTGDGQRDRTAGEVHGQEFVVKAPFARENRALLEAINAGRQVRQVADGRAREAAVSAGAATSSHVVVPAPAVNLRMINVSDSKMVDDYFETPEGEQTFINLVNRNADTIARAAGQSGAG